MPTIQRKLTRRQEARRLVRLVTRRKANEGSAPSLSHLTPIQIEVLLEYTTFRETHQQVVGGYALIIAILPVIYLMSTGSFIHQAAALAGVMLGYACLYYIEAQNSGPLRVLTQTDDLRVLPTLLLATRHHWGQHQSIYAAIFRLLDRVVCDPDEHTGLLSNDAQQQLWKIMATRHEVCEYDDREITLRILRALASVGNQAILTRIKRLAYAFEYDSANSYLLDEARDVIPIMEARLQRQQVPETLLRAADIPASASDMLLRATFAASPEPSEQLLRASRSENE